MLQGRLNIHGCRGLFILCVLTKALLICSVCEIICPAEDVWGRQEALFGNAAGDTSGDEIKRAALSLQGSSPKICVALCLLKGRI